MAKDIKDIEKEVKEQLSTEEGVLEFHRQMVESCYNALNKRDKAIYEESLTIFSEEECNRDVLPILIMGYLEVGITDRKAIIKDQSKLVYPFVETEAMHWTISKLLNKDV